MPYAIGPTGVVSVCLSQFLSSRKLLSMVKWINIKQHKWKLNWRMWCHQNDNILWSFNGSQASASGVWFAAVQTTKALIRNEYDSGVHRMKSNLNLRPVAYNECILMPFCVVRSFSQAIFEWTEKFTFPLYNQMKWLMCEWKKNSGPLMI